MEPESYTALVDGFAQGMQQLIDSHELGSAMGSAGRERAVRDYDWQRRIDKVIDVYRELAEKSDVSRELNQGRVSAAAVSEHH